MVKIDAHEVRKSPIAGSWYPGTPEALGRDVDRYLAQVPAQDVPGELVALIAPHAGYMYSGPVAAYAYKLLEGRKFDVVAVVSPSHRAYYRDNAVTDKRYYWTPLGTVPVSEELVTALAERAPVSRVPQDQEHSLEIQLPFLQRTLGEGWALLPIMMGDHSLTACRILGAGLASVLKDRSALLVASTDLSHFHNEAAAHRLDQVVLNRVNAFDPEGLAEDLASNICEACGGGPVIAAMLAARALGATQSKVLRHATSADVTGDRTSVVGYMAAAITRPGQHLEGNSRKGSDAAV
jgi:AmmeMemoRadiSam system protein B